MTVSLFRNVIILSTTISIVLFNSISQFNSITSINDQLINGCKLVEEKIDGKTSKKYTYDSFGKILQEKYVLEGYTIEYEYNVEGFLVRTTDNSPTGHKIDYFYENGLLIKTIKSYFSESTPLITEYAYESNGDLREIKETLYSTTTTTFKNKVAIAIVNDSKEYQLSTSGLILKILSKTGNSNVYTYDKNEQLITVETLEQLTISNSKKQYFFSKIKKIETSQFPPKGFPSYKNPFGRQDFLLEKVINYSADQTNKTLIKGLEEDRSFNIDNQGKLLSEEIVTGNIKKTKEYIYENCN